jgi:hypothetical protein
MTIIKRDLVLVDDAEQTVIYDVDDVAGPVNQRRTWKPGSSGANQGSVEDKLRQAVNVFSTNYQNWATMSNAQKDAANRQAQRMLANLCRHALNDFSSGGD